MAQRLSSKTAAPLLALLHAIKLEKFKAVALEVNRCHNEATVKGIAEVILARQKGKKDWLLEKQEDGTTEERWAAGILVALHDLEVSLNLPPYATPAVDMVKTGGPTNEVPDIDVQLTDARTTETEQLVASLSQADREEFDVDEFGELVSSLDKEAKEAGKDAAQIQLKEVKKQENVRLGDWNKESFMLEQYYANSDHMVFRQSKQHLSVEKIRDLAIDYLSHVAAGKVAEPGYSKSSLDKLRMALNKLCDMNGACINKIEDLYQDWQQNGGGVAAAEREELSSAGDSTSGSESDVNLGDRVGAAAFVAGSSGELGQGRELDLANALANEQQMARFLNGYLAPDQLSYLRALASQSTQQGPQYNAGAFAGATVTMHNNNGISPATMLIMSQRQAYTQAEIVANASNIAAANATKTAKEIYESVSKDSQSHGAKILNEIQELRDDIKRHNAEQHSVTRNVIVSSARKPPQNQRERGPPPSGKRLNFGLFSTGGEGGGDTAEKEAALLGSTSASFASDGAQENMTPSTNLQNLSRATSHRTRSFAPTSSAREDGLEAPIRPTSMQSEQSVVGNKSAEGAASLTTVGSQDEYDEKQSSTLEMVSESPKKSGEDRPAEEFSAERMRDLNQMFGAARSTSKPNAVTSKNSSTAETVPLLSEQAAASTSPADLSDFGSDPSRKEFGDLEGGVAKPKGAPPMTNTASFDDTQALLPSLSDSSALPLEGGEKKSQLYSIPEESPRSDVVPHGAGLGASSLSERERVNSAAALLLEGGSDAAESLQSAVNLHEEFVDNLSNLLGITRERVLGNGDCVFTGLGSFIGMTGPEVRTEIDNFAKEKLEAGELEHLISVAVEEGANVQDANQEGGEFQLSMFVDRFRIPICVLQQGRKPLCYPDEETFLNAPNSALLLRSCLPFDDNGRFLPGEGAGHYDVLLCTAEGRRLVNGVVRLLQEESLAASGSPFIATNDGNEMGRMEDRAAEVKGLIKNGEFQEAWPKFESLPEETRNSVMVDFPDFAGWVAERADEEVGQAPNSGMSGQDDDDTSSVENGGTGPSVSSSLNTMHQDESGAGKERPEGSSRMDARPLLTPPSLPKTSRTVCDTVSNVMDECGILITQNERTGEECLALRCINHSDDSPHTFLSLDGWVLLSVEMHSVGGGVRILTKWKGNLYHYELVQAGPPLWRIIFSCEQKHIPPHYKDYLGHGGEKISEVLARAFAVAKEGVRGVRLVPREDQVAILPESPSKLPATPQGRTWREKAKDEAKAAVLVGTFGKLTGNVVRRPYPFGDARFLFKTPPTYNELMRAEGRLPFVTLGEPVEDETGVMEFYVTDLQRPKKSVDARVGEIVATISGLMIEGKVAEADAVFEGLKDNYLKKLVLDHKENYLYAAWCLDDCFDIVGNTEGGCTQEGIEEQAASTEVVTAAKNPAQSDFDGGEQSNASEGEGKGEDDSRASKEDITSVASLVNGEKVPSESSEEIEPPKEDFPAEDAASLKETTPVENIEAEVSDEATSGVLPTKDQMDEEAVVDEVQEKAAVEDEKEEEALPQPQLPAAASFGDEVAGEEHSDGDEAMAEGVEGRDFFTNRSGTTRVPTSEYYDYKKQRPARVTGRRGDHNFTIMYTDSHTTGWTTNERVLRDHPGARQLPAQQP